NGGPDKPNGSGGVDKADQDGNNGCGNDDDFEDDNEGWCGRKPPKSKPASSSGEGPEELDTGVLPAGPCVDESGMAADEEECDDSDVVGGVIARPATGDVEVPTVPEEPEVLGERLARGQPVEAGPAQRSASYLGQTLPFTGSALTSYAAIAVGLLLAGAGILTARKRT
ncbi:MAG: LPXTG cell wall anchor domain-containing protein, partial [Actinomycetota bacterium]|nr:LPXTG cell wall anchor domain-containing protein [Actinomycetota bacterium]